MPTKGNVPTAKEMEGQVLAALRELDGRAHIADIDEEVKENLKPFVLDRAFKKEVQDFYKTSFSSKCARARGSLRKDGLLERGNNKGEWQLANLEAATVDRPVARRVTQFAKETITILEGKGVDRNVIVAVKELLQKYQMMSPEVRPSNDENREVETKAIRFILDKEPEKNWRRSENPNNPGFDLYRTDKNGKPVAWCEVKSLSKSFSRVSMTHTEFDFARQKGKKSWLYIVANVESNSPVLLRINDPARRAETFTYGNPWRNVAEK